MNCHTHCHDACPEASRCSHRSQRRPSWNPVTDIAGGSFSGAPPLCLTFEDHLEKIRQVSQSHDRFGATTHPLLCPLVNTHILETRRNSCSVVVAREYKHLAPGRLSGIALRCRAMFRVVQVALHGDTSRKFRVAETTRQSTLSSIPLTTR